MKIIQLELFSLPPDELLNQLKLPEVPKTINHALDLETIRNIAQAAAAGQRVSDKMIAQALVKEFLARLTKPTTALIREDIILN